MANKRPKPEEIVTKLRQVEVLTGQGMPHLDAINAIKYSERLAKAKITPSFFSIGDGHDNAVAERSRNQATSASGKPGAVQAFRICLQKAQIPQRRDLCSR